MNSSRGLLTSSVRSEEISRPSIFWSFGSSEFVRAAMVGRRSMVTQSLSQVVSAGMRPGAHMTQGTRCPPSKVVLFPARSGPAEPPWCLN